jgi:metal-responsive CopG/Arc/MetJ family transcriptional regulator
LTIDGVGSIYSYQGRKRVGTAVKKTISLPPDLAREAEEIARTEGKTLSAVIQEALRLARRQRLRRELRGIRGYWSRLAKEKGILSEKDLERYLAE